MTEHLKTDEWVWGRETIVWGYDPSHRYTFKVLEPRRGREGCLSLQYHHEKSESWFLLRGIAWALIVSDGVVCTRVLKVGDIQNLPTGTIHRLMGISDDVQVLEPSTPDRHAADKSVKKDVVRLHCVLGRECDPPRDANERVLVEECVRITEDAIASIARGETPLEINRERISGAFHL